MIAVSRRELALVVALALAFAAGEFALSGWMELSFDEAYYLLWSRHLDWGYLDHPPMVALWIRISTTIFGADEFGVRALGVTVFTLLAPAIGLTACRAFNSPGIGVYSALVWLTTPLMSAALFATPDAPLTLFAFCALAGLFAVWRGQAAGWAVVGIALGLALQSKFSALFLGAGVASAMIATPSLRRWWKSPAPYLAAFVAFAISAPFVAWNAAHDWETFAKQFARVPASGLELRFVPEFLGGWLAFANPLFVVAAAGWLLVASRASASRDAEARSILLAYVAPAFVYFLVHSLHDRVQANWLMPLYPASVMLVGAAMAEGPRWARRTAAVGVGLGALAIALFLAHAATSWPALGLADPVARIGDWRRLAKAVDAKAREEHAAFILAHGYAPAALLSVYCDPAIPVFQEEERERWEFAPAPDMSLFSKPGLAFSDADRRFDVILARHFRHVESLGRLPRYVGGAEAGVYEMFRVSDPFGPVFEGP